MAQEKEQQTQDERYVIVAEDRTTVSRGNEVGDLGIVTDIDDTGTLKTATPKEAEKQMKQEEKKGPAQRTGVLLGFDPRQGILENFLNAFRANYKNARNYTLYMVPLAGKGLSELTKGLKDALQDPMTHKAELKDMRINPYEGVPAQEVTPEIETKLADLGLSSEMLANQGQLDTFLKFGYTDVLHLRTVLPSTGEEIVHQARIALRTNPETGELRIETRAVRNDLELDRPFLGHEFDILEKTNLITDGNLGHVVELESNDGVKFPAYVSVDRQTNELVYLPTKEIRIPTAIAGVELKPEERETLVEGGSIRLEGLTSKNGTKYDATIQVNAQKRGLEFIFPKRGYMQSNRRDDGVPYTIGGQQLTTKQQNALAAGQTLYFKDLFNKKTGQHYNSYVSFDKGKRTLKFSRFNPDKAKKTELEQQSSGTTRQQQRTDQAPRQAPDQEKKKTGHKL